jgi:glycosyltransferase involved in cell wall biosynthesis
MRAEPGDEEMNQADRVSAPAPKVVFVATVLEPLAFFMAPHIRSLSNSLDTVIVASNLGQAERHFGEQVGVFELDIARKASPVKDLIAVGKLALYLRRNRVFMVHSITPKGGLVGISAGFIARTPLRFHMFTGQVWATRRGIWRRILAGIDRLIARLATHVHADSPSQRDFLIKERVVDPKKISVLGDGTVSGVDSHRFRPNPVARKRLRELYGIRQQSVVFLFLGRLTHDKGISDLIAAFDAVKPKAPDVHLMVVGPDEESITDQLGLLAAKYPGAVHVSGATAEPEAFMAAADVLCLPSYREGFGNTVIEAASVGLPAIVSEIYGLTDAVEKDRTGLMHAPRDVDGLAQAMLSLAEDPELREAMGRHARARTHERFAQTRLVEAMRQFYASYGVIIP